MRGNKFVRRQEHSALKIRALRGFSIIRGLVVILSPGQEPGPFASDVFLNLL
jgi:hypothetical protein